MPEGTNDIVSPDVVSPDVVTPDRAKDNGNRAAVEIRYPSAMPETPRRAFLIDTDTASDDAVALVMALRSKTVDVKAITVVAGNVALKQAVRNALYTAELCDAGARAA